MMAVAVVPSFMMLMTLVGGGANLLGLPPGERDPHFLHCAPAESILYMEWAARGEGTPGAKGLEGLAADAEVREFFSKIRTELLATAEREAESAPGDEMRAMLEHQPPLIDIALSHAGCVSLGVDSNAIRDSDQPHSKAAMIAGLRATLILNADKDADRFEKHLLGLMTEVMNLEAPAEGLKRWKIDYLMPGLELTVHREGSHFILGVGAGTVDRAIAGLTGETDGLGQSPRFTAAMEQTALEKIGSIFWIDLQHARDTAVKALGAEGAMAVKMMEMVGADKLHSILSTTGLEKGEFATKSFVETDGSTEGILALAGGRALKPADFAHVPADADLVVSGTLSVEQVVGSLRQVLTKVDPGLAANLDAMLAQLQTELGFSLDKDFPEAFGQQLTIFNAPSTGGYFVTAPILTLEVKDAAKAQAIFDKLMQLHANIMPPPAESGFRVRGVVLEKKEFFDHTIHFVNTIGDDVPVAPAYCLTKSHLLVALHPQSIKAYLRRQAQSPAPAGFGETFARHAPADGEVILYQYIDGKTLVRNVYGFLPYFGQLAASELQRERFAITVFDLPSAQAILPYLGDSYSLVTRTKTGLLAQGTSIFPGSSLGLLMGSYVFVGVAHSPRIEVQEAVPADVDF